MKKLLLIAFVCLLLVPTSALAATFQAPQSGTATIGNHETIKNAYLAGNIISVNGTVSGDLVAAGNTITVSGEVIDNVNIAGNSITLNGKVGKSIRVAGANIVINNNVGADIFAAGGTLSLDQSATVNDDFIAAGGIIDLSGIVKGKAYLSGGQITINGIVNGDVIIKNSDKVIIGENAVIKGNFNYQAQQEALINPGAKIEGITNFNKLANQNNISSKFKIGITIFSLIMALATFLLLLVLIYVFPKLMRNIVERSFAKPWENLGVGFVYLVVVPIAAIILLATVIGLPIGLLILGLYAVTLGLAKFLVPILVGSLIFKWIRKEKAYRLDWLTALVGAIVALIIGLIPFLGSIALFVIFLFILSQVARGGIVLIKSQR